jgi:hypothetical protein
LVFELWFGYPDGNTELGSKPQLFLKRLFIFKKYLFFSWYWCVNSGLCEVGTLLFEPHLQIKRFFLKEALTIGKKKTKNAFLLLLVVGYVCVLVCMCV